MDGERFDNLARTLGHLKRGPAARRQVMGLLASGVLTTLLGATPTAYAGGECRLVGAKCKQSAQCCAGAGCRKGKCRCKLGWLDLNGDGVCTQECQPGGNLCERGVTECCGGSTCTALINGQYHCCGLELHECNTAGGTPEEFCCSGVCGLNERCTEP